VEARLAGADSRDAELPTDSVGDLVEGVQATAGSNLRRRHDGAHDLAVQVKAAEPGFCPNTAWEANAVNNPATTAAVPAARALFRKLMFKLLSG
jgi:hypothetical protein